jgi:hypothetical protein
MGMMRYVPWALLTIAVTLSLSPAAAAQEAGFDDVPPWHWAFEAVQRLGAAGIFVGYPTNDRERTLNAVTQVYDAFAHAAHPAARGWAERFLVNLPTNWPQPLERSPLVSFRLENARVDVLGTTIAVSYVAVVSVLSAGAVTSTRAAVRAEIQKDADGRLRVNYASLAVAQPQIFR